MSYNITEQQRIAGREARKYKRVIKIANTTKLEHKQLGLLEFDLENRVVSPGGITPFRKRISEKNVMVVENPSFSDFVNVYTKAVELDTDGHQVQVVHNILGSGRYSDECCYPDHPQDSLVMVWYVSESISEYENQKSEYYKVATEQYFKKIEHKIDELRRHTPAS